MNTTVAPLASSSACSRCSSSGAARSALDTAVKYSFSPQIWLTAVSNADLAAPELEQRLRAELDASGATVVFTDLPAGSACVAAHRVLRDRPELVVVNGANLAMLLDFALHQRDTAAETARAAAAKGQASISVSVPVE